VRAGLALSRRPVTRARTPSVQPAGAALSGLIRNGLALPGIGVAKASDTTPSGAPPMQLDGNAVALYANFFRVGHNDSEFVLEFWQSYRAGGEDRDSAQMVARIVLTPAGASELHALLGDSLDQLLGQRAQSAPDQRY
jgi:hypothetical protein